MALALLWKVFNVSKTAKSPLNLIIEGKHLIGKFVDDAVGVALIAVGSLHSNENFHPVKRGKVLAKSKNGVIKAVESGLILMSLYQKHEDGFFIGREVSRFWLWLSEIL